MIREDRGPSERSAKHDPRAELDDEPSATPSAPPHADSAELPALAKTPDRPPPEKEPTLQSVVTSVDPRLEQLEPLLARSEWASVGKLLGPDDAAAKLPPNVGLLYALARVEMAGNEGAQAMTEMAIRCVAGLLGVAPQSPTALLVAKRLLRRNPVSWQQRPAPSTRTSLWLIVIVIAIGAGIGWILASPSLHIRLR